MTGGQLHIDLIGIATGNPAHLTHEAVAAVNAADLVLVPDKGAEKHALADLRHAICAKVLTRTVPTVSFAMPVRARGGDYLDAVERWHLAIAESWLAAIAQARTGTQLDGPNRVALLVWGDPSLYDSALRIAGRLRALGQAASVRVVPGISSLQLLTAAHGQPLNTLGGTVTITTGRRLREAGWPQGAETLVVMLDAGGAFEVLDPQGLTIWWGANLGMAGQALESGPLAQARPRIAERRAALRECQGWVMDIYMLRKDRAR